MTQSEVGAYILLLCHQWNRGQIPSDDMRTALIAKGDVTPHVASKFPNGKNLRLERVRKKQLEWVKSQADAGRIGALKRWHGEPNGEPIKTLMAKNSSPSPTPDINRIVVGRTAKAVPATDSEWLDSLASNPAYKHVAVKTEHAKMLVWCSAHNRQPTRRRFVSWLNRCETPLNLQATSQKPANSIPEPEGWRNWINENAPDSVYSRGGTHEGERWNRLDATTQRWIAVKIGERGAA